MRLAHSIVDASGRITGRELPEHPGSLFSFLVFRESLRFGLSAAAVHSRPFFLSFLQ